MLENPHVKSVMGWTYAPYSEGDAGFWFSIELLRKLLLTAAIASIAPVCHLKIAAAQLIACAFLVAFLWTSPYKDRLDNALQGTACLVPVLSMSYAFIGIAEKLTPAAASKHGQDAERLYVRVVESTRITLQREGARGLFRGLAANLYRTVPASAITFVGYEKAVYWLKRWNGEREDADDA